MCEIPSNSLRGLFTTLYSRVFIKKENKQNYYDSIASFFSQLNSRDALVDDNTFTHALKYNNLYKKYALCKILLDGIENSGKEKVDTTSMSVEHIMPQNKNLSTSWQNMLGPNWMDIQLKYLHTLGNLTLTGYNSELGDKPFDEKKTLIKEKTKAVKLFAEIENMSDWDAASIESRASKLSESIKSIFAIDKPNVIVNYGDDRYREHSCDNAEEATGTIPEYYILQGEKVTVNNYMKMLIDVTEKLYSSHKHIIESIAKNDLKIIDWSDRVILSYNQNNVCGSGDPVRLKNTNIYIGTGINAMYIIAFIKALLQKCDIDTDEFVYSSRQNRK